MHPTAARNHRVNKIMSNGVTNHFKRFSQYADDAQQEAALFLLQHAADQRHDGALALNAMRAGYNATIRRDTVFTKYAPVELNAPQSTGRSIWEDEIGDFIPSSDPSPEEIAEQHSLATVIENATATLSPAQQRIVKLLAQGYSKHEIAAKMGISPQLVNYHITKNIRPVFTAHGLSGETRRGCVYGYWSLPCK